MNKKNFVRLAAFLILSLALSGLYAPQAQATSRRDLCTQSANVILRYTARMDVNNTFVYGCLCQIPQDQYDNYMSVCQSASDQQMQMIIAQMQSSLCMNKQYLINCLR